jgi:hypothetical protein
MKRSSRSARRPLIGGGMSRMDGRLLGDLHSRLAQSQLGRSRRGLLSGSANRGEPEFLAQNGNAAVLGAAFPQETLISAMGASPS